MRLNLEFCRKKTLTVDKHIKEKSDSDDKSSSIIERAKPNSACA